MIEPHQIILLVTGLLLSAFFSGIEIAFMSVNKLQIELSEKNGVLSGRILWHLLKHPSRLMGTALIGNTLALVLYGFAIAGVLHTLLSHVFPERLQYDLLIVVIQVAVASVVVLFTAEFLPRSLFVINPNRMLQVLALPILIFYYLLYPVVYVIVSLSKLVAEKIFKIEFPDQKPVFGFTDLNAYIKSRLYQPEQEHAPEVDSEIFHNALEFKTVKVRECMVPRTEIEAVEVDDSVEKLRHAFTATGHSKILIYRDNIDNIIGYCHQLDMFKQPKRIEDILSVVSLVPESMMASELFIKFVAEHRSVAVVLDEFGGTAGIVTVEDVIEEIFGEIEDEYDVDEMLLEQVLPEQGIYTLSGRLEVDYLNDKYELDLPEGDYETLGGFIFSVAGEIPTPGDVVEYPPFSITILSMDENRINTVRLVKTSEFQVEPER
ncbi:HlyC/CorC family transporter [Pontibacter sp. BT310]|uniref:Hemolysin family protein n=1 Tax=Pontibacter populi TaxID=890055 RepID=A0ABS6X8W7_9BACT|nr:MULTISPECIES: hemolysin family protein [Pontibacter]MBJ6117583.1 HlyC/CorC family transporter [Pontibacter sp. BT310]MBR0570008.1 HlyC/CorC family transporter [Microvirga sp. STS03]MBW3364435.1 hemolysin family protein [Pontibacter populi]